MLAVCFAMFDLKVSERTLSELVLHLCLNVLARDSNRKNKNDRENKYFKDNEESICAMFQGMADMFEKGYRSAVGKLFADKRAFKMIETCFKQTLHPYTLSTIGLFLRDIARHWSGKLNIDFIQLLENWERDVKKSMKAIEPHFCEVLGIICLDIAVCGSFHSILIEVSKKLMELGSKMLTAPTISVAEAMHKWAPSPVLLSSSAVTLHTNCMLSLGISYYRLAVYNSLVKAIKYADKHRLSRYFLEVMEEQGMEDAIYAKCYSDGWIESFKYLVYAFMRFKKAEG
ncbi:Vacuolar protein sorting 26B (Vps26B) [Monocercomonoides exilis]|uniref:Vacuolar protein sorting 26B (Vps26B) n=1 Tax=Monocercomonoides exilis TaxID=2049356 RepID=UPI00355A95AF|nr:Vacuolar protein sorting 26B (Vps26B) [Monocercomonoides exilis]|eukprot:MONOS_8958.1-p1 / transcript=MONOS_8958.1 / gene=MONOS_8958 / organism=Monocercomonoides_exilis_PA203 / gene_product= Vacuolar protein sorting 26B (Vps26B) / transcript_product= Vacuolar protein sorting 26B (Vps26B) / location=Mono_scaffold00353:39619-40620(-) / protein_length=286 / sequence_SO=supercontig / SO=protein_coding / is_pseudo=false